MKSNPQQIFENLVGGAIRKLKDYYTVSGGKEALEKLNDTLKTDRTSKELDANRYFYLFELMCESRQPLLIEDALNCISNLITEKFLNVGGDIALQKSLLLILHKSLPRLPELAGSILVQIRSPRLQVLQMMFQAYPLCLEGTQQRIATAALSIIARVFSFRDKELNSFTYKVYQLYRPLIAVTADFELTTQEQQHQILGYYVGKVLGEVVTKVELALAGDQIAKGKFGLCFMCRAPADFYCKDTKVPVCSADCKKNHLQEESKVSWLAVSHSQHERSQFEEFLRKRSLERSEHISTRLLALQFLIQVLLNSEYRPRVALEIFPEPSAGVTQLKKLECLYAFLYLEQRKQLCQHIFYELLLHSELQSDYRLFAEGFFRELFSDERLFLTYYNFDLQPNRINIVKDVVAKYSKQPNRLLLETLINNVYAQNLKRFPDEQYEFILQQNEIVIAFNGNTQKGCELLRKLYSEEHRDSSIAAFFRKNEKSLNRERLGEFFARNNSESQNVLLKFLELLNLNSLEVDDALREVFYHFSVSESQQIFRIIEVFSKVYSTPKLSNPDDLFAFAYFILMLQTELHSPAIEKRMSLEDMLGRVNSFNPTLAIDKEYLSQIYYNIKTKPFSKSQKKVRYGNFEKLDKQQVGQYSKSLILWHNWLPLYNWLSAENSFANKELIYRVCSVLIRQEVAQHFLHLLTRDLPRVDMLARDVTEQEVFLVSSVLTLMWQEPNHVRGQWRHILELLAKYRTLVETVSNKRSKNQPANHQESNYEKLRLYLSESQIDRLFQCSKDFNAESLQLFTGALALISDGCFLNGVAIMVELNYQRIDVVWEKILGYVSVHGAEHQIHTLSELLVLLSTLTNNAKDEEVLVNQLLSQSVQIVKSITATPGLALYGASVMAHLLSQTNFKLHPELWEAVVASTFSMPLQHKLQLTKFLQTSNPKLYEELVVKTFLSIEDIDFLMHNVELLQAHPELFEPHLPNVKNRELTKLFILPQYKDYLLAHLSEFTASPELCRLLTTQLSKMSGEQVQRVHSFVLEHLKQSETQFIQLVVSLLMTSEGVKAIDTVTKLMEQYQNQFPEVNRQVRLGVEDKPTEAASFKLNYAIVVKKTVMELTLLKVIQDIHKELSLECLKALQPLVQQAVKSSRSFNRNIVLRWQLWRDGLLKELKQLPGLMKKERSSQLLMLSILELISRKSESYDRLVSYGAALYNDTSQRLSLYVQHSKYYRNCQREDLNYYFFSEIEREVADMRKLASQLPVQLQAVDWNLVEKQPKKELMRAIAEVLKSGLYKFREAGLALEASAEEEQLVDLHRRILDTL